MRSRNEFVVAALIAALTALLLLAACSKQNPGVVGQNVPPETTLSFASDTGDTTGLRVHLTWSGSDTDGEVVAYLARWDTLDWFSVSCTDSVFQLEVGSSDSTAAFDTYTFSVKSIDDDGAEDPTPASLTFTVRNTFPETEIIHGPGGISGPVACFEWRGWDNDGVVVGYGYRLYTWELSEWVEIAGEDSLPPDEFDQQFGPLAGLHRFEVWSIDDGGAIDPTPAAREFTCNPELSGPTLRVRTNVLGNHGFRGPRWPARYDIPIDIFAGEELVFDWYSDEEGYSSCPIMGFSYAFDDTSTWCQSYSMLDTHFEVAPDVGQHSLYVAVLGAANDVTRGRIALNVLETGLDDYILVVDDYDHFELNPLWGSDADRDAFYDTLTMGYAHPALQWDVAEHVEMGQQQPPDAATLAGASTVLWYCDDSEYVLGDLFSPLFHDYSLLSGYVRVGGNLVLCGYKALGQMLEETYPITISASDTTMGRVFARDYLGVGYADNSGGNANPEAPWSYGYCFRGAVPGGTGIPDDRIVQLEAMYIDSVGVGGFPEPGKWWPYADPPTPQYLRCGMGYVDVFEPYDGRALETHVVNVYLNMNFDGRTCVMLLPTGTNRGNVFYLGFPLYYLQTHQVKAVFDKVLPLFGEVALQ